MNNSPKSAADIPLELVYTVPVEWLKLDPRNPRLILVGEGLDDAGIIAQLYKAENLTDLLQSIAANGYMDFEPLIVLEEEDKLTVLEGNRRLAAIRLFREPALVSRLFEKERLRITPPVMPDRHRRSLEKVSVFRVPDRETARSYLGFKHIKGAAKWVSYAKAKYAADWYRAGGVPLEDIAKAIGDRHDTVKRMVHAIYVLEQAKDAELFQITDRMSPRFSFSHLYTALSRSQFRAFLGLRGTWTLYQPSPNPVSPDHLDRLGEVLKWLYGSKEEGIDSVIKSQNPHIRQLAEVLGNSEGLAVLRSIGSLSVAYVSTQPAGQRFSEALVRARREIEKAVTSLRGFDGVDKSLFDIAQDIWEAAKVVRRRMKEKMDELESGET